MPILAKSSKGGRQVTLTSHTLDVLEVAGFLFGDDSRKGRLLAQWLRFFRVKDQSEQFLACLKVAILFHDWGKANQGFQDTLRGDFRQIIRHEHLSALLLCLPGVQDWLAPVADVDFDLVVASVACHHLKFSGTDDLFNWEGEEDEIELLTEDTEYSNYVNEVRSRLGLACPDWTPGRFWVFNGAEHSEEEVDALILAERLKARLQGFKKALRQDSRRAKLLMAVRSALIVCDAAGSGLVRTGRNIQTWLEGAFPAAYLQAAEIKTLVIEPRLSQLQAAGQWRDWDEFQDDCGNPEELPARSLLLAPCGSGKTLAGWRWIEATLKNVSARRVVFLYPTRGTANEGFRDYVAWAPESEGALMHGSSTFELDGMFDNPEDVRSSRNYRVERALYSMGFWSKRVFAATVDQFLSFLHYNYGALCMLPVLSDAVVVIDEVHSFDKSMFSSLKLLLREFDVPVLCMTASLSKARCTQLVENAGLHLYKKRPQELATVAGAARYEIARCSREQAIEEVVQALRAGKRVLWVCNRVDEAQTVFRMIDFDSERKWCYHSRFRLKDRQHRHSRVVAEMRRGRPAGLVVGTQVCEMSLDLDADVLVTEKCPIPSLIQRLGRCNRGRDARPNGGRVLVIEPNSPRPYTVDELRGVDGFLDSLVGRRVSQADLERSFDEHFPEDFEAPLFNAFLEGGPFASSEDDQFRDIDEFSVNAVLDHDLSKVKEAQTLRAPIDGWILPVPRYPKHFDEDPSIPRYLRLAPASHYSTITGFCKEPVPEEEAYHGED